MKIFDTTTALAAATLTAGQMVSVKEIGEYRIKASGSGITLANGNVAEPVASGTAVNVLQWGADPTGVADSASAIQAAVDSGASKIVFNGLFKIDTAISITNTVTLVGLNQSTTGVFGQGFAVLTNDVIIENMYINPQSKYKYGIQVRTGGDNFKARNLSIDYCYDGILAYGNTGTIRNVRYENIRVTKAGRIGLTFDLNIVNGMMVGCYVHDSKQGYHIEGNGCSQITLRDCEADSCGLTCTDPVPNTEQPDTYASDILLNGGNDITIDNFAFTNSLTTGIRIEGNTINGLVVKDCDIGARIENLYATVSNVTISNCRNTGFYTNTGGGATCNGTCTVENLHNTTAHNLAFEGANRIYISNVNLCSRIAGGSNEAVINNVYINTATAWTLDPRRLVIRDVVQYLTGTGGGDIGLRVGSVVEEMYIDDLTTDGTGSGNMLTFVGTQIFADARMSRIYNKALLPINLNGVTYANRKIRNDTGQYYDNAAPVQGTWSAGDIVWDRTPTAGATSMGWVCVTAGTPGTWKTFGTITA